MRRSLAVVMIAAPTVASLAACPGPAPAPSAVATTQTMATREALPPPPPPPPPPDDEYTLKGVVDDQPIVVAHNQVRAEHCAPPLRWSDALAAEAEAWAQHLAADGCAFEHSQSEHGENLAAGTTGALDAAAVVAMWAREEASYDWRRPGFSMTTGHFTQVVWKDTIAVGCAMVTCGRQDTWVCNYDPPGNVEGDFALNVGAVVFANVLPQRDRDVDFDWDKVVSIQGDSGPYLHYTLARCWNIEHKAGEVVDGAADLTRLSHDAEWAVARRLLDFGDYVARAAVGCEPHIVAHYLLELAGDFSRWYTIGNDDPALRVLCEDPATRRARLALVHAVKRALTRGLALLGLGEVRRM